MLDGRLMVRFQPGGSGEKQLLLQKLIALDEAKDMRGLTVSLRGWRRHFQRALEVGAVLPDGTLLLAALEGAVQQIAVKDSQAAFRVAQTRAQHPTQDGVWKLSQCLLAETETLALLTSSATSTPVPSTPTTG